jgi:hypothetical protein
MNILKWMHTQYVISTFCLKVLRGSFESGVAGNCGGLIQQDSRACEKAQRFATAFFPAISTIPLL